MRILIAALAFAFLLPGILNPGPESSVEFYAYPSAHAAGSQAEQKDAFESAKELGTIEAWEAFLNAYDDGFYADLVRAYVRKLGQSPAPESNTAKNSATAPTKKIEQPLATVIAEAGRSPWRLRRYEMDEGNASAMAASVASDGVELLFHCDGDKRLAGILRESSRGKYPKFDERIRQGLAAKGAKSGSGTPALIPMEFSDGTAYSVSAYVQELTGEVSLAQNAKGDGFRTAGNLVADLMSKKTVNIDAAPFGATLQLKNSRKTLCSVIRKCGGGVSKCGSVSKRTVSKKRYKKRRKRKTTRAPICSAGKVWNGTNCEQSPYLDNQGHPLDGYIIDQYGNINQDNGGGE